MQALVMMRALTVTSLLCSVTVVMSFKKITDPKELAAFIKDKGAESIGSAKSLEEMGYDEDGNPLKKEKLRLTGFLFAFLAVFLALLMFMARRMLFPKKKAAKSK